MKKYSKPLILLLVAASLFVTVAANRTKLKATNVVYAWERDSLKYQNSNVRVYFDGNWVSFVHQVDFDNALYSPASCNGGTTRYGGVMEFGQYHTDNAPAGAPGFYETRNWRLVDCDRNGNGRFDNPDLQAVPPDGFVTFASLTPISKDVVVNCTSGNCLNEIVTTLEVVLDNDCNGQIDVGVPALVCFYAEARLPVVGTPPYWSGPLQARISAGGGEKTVNFSPLGPTAVTLQSFAGTSDGIYPQLLLVSVTLVALSLAYLGWSLLRSRRERAS